MVCVVVVYVFVCGLSKHVRVLVRGSLCGVVWYGVCAVLRVLLFFLCVCLRGVCVIERVVVYGVLLLTVCAHASLN